MKVFLLLQLLAVLGLWRTANCDYLQTDLLVAQHNKYRAQYGVPGLVGDAALVSSARNWASTCSFSHTPGYKVGENLAWGTSSTVDSLFQLWVDEKAQWPCSTNACNSCGHWTQIISKYSTKVGCANVTCSGRTNYLVCQYDPPGNNGQHPTGGVCSTPTTGSSPVTAPVTAPVTPPRSSPVTAPVTSSPTTTITMPSYSKCKVSGTDCRTTTCTSIPRGDGKYVYCGCNDPNQYDWTVTNPNTAECPYPIPYSSCTTKCGGSTNVPCVKSPWLVAGTFHCPCSSTGSYYPVTNVGTSQCRYSTSVAAFLEEDPFATSYMVTDTYVDYIGADVQTSVYGVDTTQSTETSTPPPLSDNSMWIGIGIGAAILVLAIVIAIIIVLRKRSNRI